VRACALLLAPALALAPTPAAAAGPGEVVLGLQPSYAFVVLEDRAQPNGGGVSLFLNYGMTDAIALLVTGIWSGHDLQPDEKKKRPGGLYQVVSAAAGFSYTFDTVPLRPFIDAAVGFLHQWGADRSATSVSLQLGVGAEYNVLSWLSVGAAFHYHAFLQNPAEFPVYFDVGPRVALRF
jgi:hypothetical protein